MKWKSIKCSTLSCLRSNKLCMVANLKLNCTDIFYHRECGLIVRLLPDPKTLPHYCTSEVIAVLQLHVKQVATMYDKIHIIINHLMHVSSSSVSSNPVFWTLISILARYLYKSLPLVSFCYFKPCSYYYHTFTIMAGKDRNCLSYSFFRNVKMKCNLKKNTLFSPAFAHVITCPIIRMYFFPVYFRKGSFFKLCENPQRK